MLVIRGEGQQGALILFWMKLYRLIDFFFFLSLFFGVETEATLKNGTLVTVKGGKVLFAEGWLNVKMYVTSGSQAVHPNLKFKYLVQLQHEQRSNESSISAFSSFNVCPCMRQSWSGMDDWNYCGSTALAVPQPVLCGSIEWVGNKFFGF